MSNMEANRAFPCMDCKRIRGWSANYSQVCDVLSFKKNLMFRKCGALGQYNFWVMLAIGWNWDEFH